MNRTHAPNHRWAAKIVPFAVVVLGILVIGLWVLSVLSGFRSRANRYQCANNLKAIGSALHNYHQQYGSLPPIHTTDANGKRLHSWRVLILPYFDLQDVEEKNRFASIQLDKPWDERPNRQLGEKMPHWGRPVGLGAYKCWKDTASPLSTSYVAVVGPETAWSDNCPLKLEKLQDPANTILVVEKKDSGIHWMEPKDIAVSDLPVHSGHDGWVHVLFANGEVRAMPEGQLDRKSVKARLINDEGRSVDGEAAVE